MIDWLYSAQIGLGVVAGLFAIVMGLAKRKPSGYTVGALALVELGLGAQLAVSISLVFLGQRAERDTFEFFAYLIVALMVPAAAVFWALLERSRWSTLVLGVGALTVAVMLVRMHQIWFGI
jgi:hypothetical protein